VTSAVGTRDASVDRTVHVRSVSHRFEGPDGRPVDVLDGIDLTIEQGSFVCLVGPSGCGKSTLLRLLAGFLRPTAGEIHVGTSLVEAPSHERGVVFQQPTLYPWLTVAENVGFGLKMRGVKRAERDPIVREHLELVGLADVADFRPYELSGGMQQRAQIARVLANDPDIILMDEPFGALDAITRDRLQDELLRIWRTTGSTVLFITHSVDEAVYLGTRVLVMGPRPGRIVLDVAEPFSTEPRDADVRHSAEFAAAAKVVADALQAASAG
jgi:taurine transport system ATP-binding protein